MQTCIGLKKVFHMLKDLFRNRFLIGALAFFVLIVGCSLLYMRHVELQTAGDVAVTGERIKKWNARQTIYNCCC